MAQVTTKPYLFRRFVAGFIDYTVIMILIIFYLYAFGSPNDEGGYSADGILALPPVLMWGILTIGTELTLGATMGNILVHLKPIPKSGLNRKLTFSESLKRHLVDPIDMQLFGIVAIIAVKNSQQHQRLGDLWAKTVVVHEKYYYEKDSRQ